MSIFPEIELNSILKFGITTDQISAFDILCLPENIAAVASIDDLYDASDAIVLSKLLKIQGLNCANSYDLHLPCRVLERRSKEKWFGMVFIRKNVVIPLFVSVLGNLISSEIADAPKDKQQPIPKIHIELKIKKPNCITSIKYDGDASTLITILKNIEADTTDSE